MNSNEKDMRSMSQGTMLIGRYSVQSVIGSGGFGITYIAWDTFTDSYVAIKEYYPSGIVNRGGDGVTITLQTKKYQDDFIHGKQRFLSEAKDLLKFKESSHIVNVLNFFEENSTAYMVMEYLNGYTLEKYLKESGDCLDVNTALYIMNKIMDALEEIHNAGVIHRDISPNNVMIMSDFSVKLIVILVQQSRHIAEKRRTSLLY